jgi:hypothetical protein
MLNGCFEGYILNRYGSYDVVRNGYKFIHCDLTNKVGFLTITIYCKGYLFISSLNVGSFIQIQNFGVTFWNKFEKGNWSFVLKVGTAIMIEQLNPFMLDLRFVDTHSIL